MSILGFNNNRQLSNYKLILQITHVPTGHKVEFPAFLEMMSDAYTQQWSSEDVYGRMDPIATFINTRRAVSLAWNVPAQSYYDAQNNLQKVNTLLSFMYPLYQDNGVGGATAINQAPLLRIKFGNLVQTPSGDGLLGYVNGFTFDPDLEHGMFYQEKGQAASTKYSPEYYPKTFRLNTEMNVLHEHSLGFKRSADGSTFSYRDKGMTDSVYPYATGLNPLVNDGTAIAARVQSAKDAKVAAAATLEASQRWDVGKTDQGKVQIATKGPYNAEIPLAIRGQGIAEQQAAGVQPGVQLEPANEAEANPESVQNTLGDYYILGNRIT